MAAQDLRSFVAAYAEAHPDEVVRVSEPVSIEHDVMALVLEYERHHLELRADGLTDADDLARVGRLVGGHEVANGLTHAVSPDQSTVAKNRAGAPSVPAIL